MTTITDSIGRVLAGRYRIESPLGTGASAHVFAAHDTTLNRRVAVKVLHPALAADAGFLRRFLAEAQAAAALTHPHVLSVYDWGQDERGPFLVFEHLGGGSLRDLLDTGRRLTVAQAVAVGVQAAQGLAYAHGRGFVHRDVKPANLLFDDDGRLSIADFGLARALSEAAWTEPAGTTVGTARYAAPEQARGQRVEGRSDVYSLALVLYESVTGLVPFTADTTIGTLMARVGATLPPHPALGPLGDVLAPAAAPHITDRLDAAALARRLQTLALQLPEPDPLPLGRTGGRGAAVGADATELGLPARPARRPASPALAGISVPVGPADTGVAAAGAVGADVAEAAAAGVASAAGVAAAGVVGDGAAAGVAEAGAAEADTGPLSTTGMPPGGPGAPGDPPHPAPGADRSPTTSRSTTGAPTPGGAGGIGHDGSPTASVPAVTAGAPSGTRRRRRWPWIVAAVVVVLALAAGGLSYAAVKTRFFVPTHPVPPLGGLTTAQAQAKLRPDHLSLRVSGHQSSMTVPNGDIISQSPRKGVLLKQGDTVHVVVSSGPPPVSVPDLTQVTGGCNGASQVLQSAQLKLGSCTSASSTTVAAGGIISYQPTGHAPEGSAVDVTVSSGPPMVSVPSLNGITTCSGVDSAMQAAGLQASCSTRYNTAPAGTILSVSPSTTAQLGSTVTVVISLGKPAVPNLQGDSVAQATQALQQVGLSVGAVYGPAGGTVFFTSPGAGTKLAPGSAVNLYVL